MIRRGSFIGGIISLDEGVCKRVSNNRGTAANGSGGKNSKRRLTGEAANGSSG
jgi:hypothetical protein